jgi:hypothetical protein
MRKHILYLTVLLLCKGALRAQETPPEPATLRASASLEAGAESAQRRYVRPRLSFNIPWRFGRVFTDLDFYHRTNGDLEGEIDFWLGLGLATPLSSNSEAEVVLRHFCRHETSRDYPEVLDINELLARVRYVSGGIQLGFGAGTYLGTSNNHSGLLVLSFAWPRILRSELSASAELKWVDLEELLYDFELAIALDPSVDLVVRFTRHYVYPATTYFGLRFNFRNAAAEHLDQFRFRAGFLPEDESTKVSAAVEFNLHFFRTPRSQLLLTLNGDIPIERGKAFLGSFRPEEIRYQTDIVYERRAGPGLLAFVYGRYDLLMPVDVAKRFESSFGLGIGLKNQTYFKKLEKNFRFVVSAGPNYGHGHDIGLAVGLNTTGKPADIGGDIEMDLGSGESRLVADLFVEFGSTPKIRPFFSLERITEKAADKPSTRYLVGLELFAWH